MVQLQQQQCIISYFFFILISGNACIATIFTREICVLRRLTMWFDVDRWELRPFEQGIANKFHKWIANGLIRILKSTIIEHRIIYFLRFFFFFFCSQFRMEVVLCWSIVDHFSHTATVSDTPDGHNNVFNTHAIWTKNIRGNFARQICLPSWHLHRLLSRNS